MSDELVIHEDKHIGYFYSCLTAATDSIRKILQSDNAVAIHGYPNIKVESDYPIEEKAYPYVRVGYQNDDFRPAAPMEWVRVNRKDGGHADLACYLFTGRITIDIYALSPVEVSLISDAIISCIEIDPTYRNLLRSNPYINIEPNMATMKNNTSNDSLGTPWDADQVTCFKQFSFNVRGEFYYINKTDPTFITKIQLNLIVDEDEVQYIIASQDDNTSGDYIVPNL